MTLKKILGALIFVVLAVIISAEENGKGDLPEVEIEVLVAPPEDSCGRKSKNKDVLKVNYVGYLPDGTKFDSSYDSGEPMFAQLGSKTVLKGWDIGLLDMCVGEKRKLTIPPRYAFGSKGHGIVPGKSNVIYEVELLDLKSGIGMSDAFGKLDLDMDGFLTPQEFEDQLAAASKLKGFPMPIDEFTLRQMVQLAFQTGDKDRDGLLSQNEFGKIPGIKNILTKDEL